MIRYVILDELGIYVVAAGLSRVAPEEEHMVVTENVPVSVLAKSFLVGGVLTVRPEAPEMTHAAGVFSFAGCPVGTVIAIADGIDGELITEVVTDAGTQDQSFTFAESGKYQIEIAPPLPFTPKRYELEVAK